MKTTEQLKIIFSPKDVSYNFTKSHQVSVASFPGAADEKPELMKVFLAKRSDLSPSEYSFYSLPSGYGFSSRRNSNTLRLDRQQRPRGGGGGTQP